MPNSTSSQVHGRELRPSFYNAGKGNVLSYFESLDLATPEKPRPKAKKSREELLQEYKLKKQQKQLHQAKKPTSPHKSASFRKPNVSSRVDLSQPAFASSLPAESSQMFSMAISPPQKKATYTKTRAHGIENREPQEQEYMDNKPVTLRRRTRWSKPQQDSDFLSVSPVEGANSTPPVASHPEVYEQLIESEKKKQELMESLAGANREIQRLEQTNEELSAEKEADRQITQQEHDSLARVNSELQARQIQLEMQVKELEDQLMHKQEECHKLTSTVKMKEDSLSQFQKEVIVVREQLDVLRGQRSEALDRLEKELEAEKHKFLQEKKEKVELKVEVGRLQGEHHQQFELMKELTAENEVLRKKNQEHAEKLAQQALEHEDRVATLRKTSDEKLHALKDLLHREYEEKHEYLRSSLSTNEQIRRILHNKVMQLKGNIRVFCRVRPLLPSEKTKSAQDTPVFNFPNDDIENRIIEITASKASHKSYGNLSNKGGVEKKWPFEFDQVFGPTTTQEVFFREISALVQSTIDGFRVCVFAYGQTGSGKTYTMQGQGLLEQATETSSHGVVARAVIHIFSTMKEREEYGWSYSVTLEIVELYNETFRDLIAKPRKGQPKIELKLDEDGIPRLTNTKSINVESIAHVLQVLDEAVSQRITKQTKCNDQSSRSHCIVTLRVSGSNSRTNEIREGKLHLIDLAGSERLSESGSGDDKATLNEAKAINTSLSSLGNVISALKRKVGGFVKTFLYKQ